MANAPCKCRLCERHRMWQAIKRDGAVEQLRALIDEIEEQLSNAESDLEIDKAILNGSWPSARECAQRILEKVAEREAAELAKESANA